MTITYTLSALTDDTLQQLRGTTRDLVNFLGQGIDAPASGTQETIYLSNNVNGVTIGSLLAIGQETLYVIDVFDVSLSVLVVRGYDDTTPVSAPQGATVAIDPPWPRSIVQARIRDEIRSWTPRLYRVMSIEVPIVSQQRGYDLSAVTSPIIRVLRVTAPQPPYIGAPGAWELPATSNTALMDPTFPFIYNANADTDEFASGKSITLVGQTLPSQNGNIHVVYASPCDVDTSWTETTDMIADVGMDEKWLDIPGLGASARLLRGMSVRRAMLNVASQSADAQDVTMPAILQAAQQFRNDADLRISYEQQNLYSDWPIRQSNQ